MAEAGARAGAVFHGGGNFGGGNFRAGGGVAAFRGGVPGPRFGGVGPGFRGPYRRRGVFIPGSVVGAVGFYDDGHPGMTEAYLTHTNNSSSPVHEPRDDNRMCDAFVCSLSAYDLVASATPASVNTSAAIWPRPRGSCSASAEAITPITGTAMGPIAATEAGRRASAANQAT